MFDLVYFPIKMCYLTNDIKYVNDIILTIKYNDNLYVVI